MKAKPKRILSFIFKTIAILLIAFVLVGFVKINDVLHPPRIIPQGNTLRKFNIPYQSVDLITDDDIRLSAWYTPPRNGAVILIAHGYGNKRPEWVYELVAKKGYGVIAWDARAHGESDGEISTIGYLEVLDVKAALQYVLSQPGVKHVGAWGGSMGGATLIRAAADFPEIEALWVDSSFASLDEEINYLVPVPMINPLAKSLAKIETGIDLGEINPIEDIARISPRPVYIVHSLADAVAPPDAGRRLYEAAQEPRFLWESENAPHQMIYLENPNRYKRRLIAFFR